MFALETMTPAKFMDVKVLSQKNRKLEDDPGVKLVIELEVPDSALESFSSMLKMFFFMARAKGSSKKQPEQGKLDGVEVISDTPDLTEIGQHVPVLPWEQELTGYHLVIDRGLGDKRSNLLIDDCMLSTWRFKPRKGGSVLVKFVLESENASEQQWGKLAKLKRRGAIKITLQPPELKQQSLPTGDDAEAAAKKHQEFFKGPDNPFGSTDKAEAARGGRAPKPAKPGQEVTPTDAFINSQPSATPQ